MKADSELRWGNGPSRQHQFEMTGSLSLQNIFHTWDPRAELVNRSGSIRREIVKTLVADHFPEYMRPAYLEPAADLSSNARFNANSQWNIRDTGGDVQFCNNFSLKMGVSTSAVVHPLQAFMNERLTAAVAIADLAMSALHHKYLGRSSHKHDFKAKAHGNQLVDYVGNDC